MRNRDLSEINGLLGSHEAVDLWATIRETSPEIIWAILSRVKTLDEAHELWALPSVEEAQEIVEHAWVLVDEDIPFLYWENNRFCRGNGQ